MGILRQMRKSAKKAAVSDVMRTVELTRKFIELKLLELRLDKCEAQLMTGVWQDKDQVFKHNFCGNILKAWFVMAGKPYSVKTELTVFDKEDPAKTVARFSIKEGLQLAA